MVRNRKTKAEDPTQQKLTAFFSLSNSQGSSQQHSLHGNSTVNQGGGPPSKRQRTLAVKTEADTASSDERRKAIAIRPKRRWPGSQFRRPAFKTRRPPFVPSQRLNVKDMPLSLNEEQLAAACADVDKPLLIVAGAGSGKTTTLLARIWYMVMAQGVSPEEILAVTFTNDAAKSLRTRLAELRMEGADLLRALTFHAFCNTYLLQPFHKRLGFQRPPRVLADTAEGRVVAAEVLRLAALETGRVQAARWLNLPPQLKRQDGSTVEEAEALQTVTWQQILQATAEQLPDLYNRAVAEAQQVVAQQLAKKKGKVVPQQEVALRDLQLTVEVFDRLKYHFNPGMLQNEAKLGAVPSAQDVNNFTKWIDTVKRLGITGFLEDRQFMYNIYQERLRRANLVDFNDMLLLAEQLLRDHPDIREQVQGVFKYMLIDEFQDSNQPQVSVMNLLQKDCQRITVVGDDAQSIYGFRGSRAEVFNEYKNVYDHQQLMRILRINYRSRPTILKISDKMLVGHDGLIEKALVAAKPDNKQPVRIREYGTLAAEAEGVADEILRLHNMEGLPWSSFACLMRVFNQGKGKTYSALEAALFARSIPYRIVKGLKLTERKAVKDLMSYCSLLLDPTDNESFRRIYNTPPRRLGKTFLQQVEAAYDAAMLADGLRHKQRCHEGEHDHHRIAHHHDRGPPAIGPRIHGPEPHGPGDNRAIPSLFSIAQQLADEGRLSPAHTKAYRGLMRLLEQLRVDLAIQPLPVFLELLLTRTDYLVYLKTGKAKKEAKVDLVSPSRRPGVVWGAPAASDSDDFSESDDDEEDSNIAAQQDDLVESKQPAAFTDKPDTYSGDSQAPAGDAGDLNLHNRSRFGRHRAQHGDQVQGPREVPHRDPLFDNSHDPVAQLARSMMPAVMPEPLEADGPLAMILSDAKRFAKEVVSEHLRKELDMWPGFSKKQQGMNAPEKQDRVQAGTALQPAQGSEGLGPLGPCAVKMDAEQEAAEYIDIAQELHGSHSLYLEVRRQLLSWLDSAANADEMVAIIEREVPTELVRGMLNLRGSGQQILADWLTKLHLDSSVDEEGFKKAEAGPDQVVVSTIHAAKGLEWHTVFVMYVIEGVMPMQYRATADVPRPKLPQHIINAQQGEDWYAEQHRKEEQRLAYVACSRAKENLYMTYARVNEAWKFQLIPSPYLQEVLKLRDNESTAHLVDMLVGPLALGEASALAVARRKRPFGTPSPQQQRRYNDAVFRQDVQPRNLDNALAFGVAARNVLAAAGGFVNAGQLLHQQGGQVGQAVAVEAGIPPAVQVAMRGGAADRQPGGGPQQQEGGPQQQAAVEGERAALQQGDAEGFADGARGMGTGIGRARGRGRGGGRGQGGFRPPRPFNDVHNGPPVH